MMLVSVFHIETEQLLEMHLWNSILCQEFALWLYRTNRAGLHSQPWGTPVFRFLYADLCVCLRALG